MKRTEDRVNTEHKLTVSTPVLQSMIGCGKDTAIKIGTEAKARVKIGRRVLWNVEKVSSYLNSISKGE